MGQDMSINRAKAIGKAMEGASEEMLKESLKLITDEKDRIKYKKMDENSRKISDDIVDKTEQLKKLYDYIEDKTFYKSSDELRRKNFLIKKYESEIEKDKQNIQHNHEEIMNYLIKYPAMMPLIQKFIMQIESKISLIEQVKVEPGNWTKESFRSEILPEPCPICLEDFKDGESLIVHDKKHKVHKKCFKDGNMTFCPMDRAPFTGRFSRFGKRKSKSRRKKSRSKLRSTRRKSTRRKSTKKR